ncbi:MAG TPA: hypothetical protein VJT72_06015 [Pseudonocardiaceae bacterium]|nr:hypothetical protein [Pseudonocardiaceae bacterium]
MSDALSFVEIDGQHVELLPARTVLSLFSVGAPKGGDAGAPAGGAPAGMNGGPGGTGGAGSGEAGFWHNWIYVEGDMINTITGGAGGAAPGGAVGGGAVPAASAR